MVIFLYVNSLLVTEAFEKLMDKIGTDIRAEYKVTVGIEQSKFPGMVVVDVEGGTFVPTAVSFRNFFVMSHWETANRMTHPFRLALGYFLIQVHLT